MLMVMFHNDWERRCPFCFSRKLGVIDYDLASHEYRKLGRYWFLLKCERCNGICQDINNLESKSERIAKVESKRKIGEEGVNEKVPV